MTAASSAAAWPPMSFVFDPEKIDLAEPEKVADLPEGAPRYIQGAKGIHYTIVNGSVLMKNGAHTGVYPGRVLRSSNSEILSSSKTQDPFIARMFSATMHTCLGLLCCWCWMGANGSALRDNFRARFWFL